MCCVARVWVTSTRNFLHTFVGAGELKKGAPVDEPTAIYAHTIRRRILGRPKLYGIIVFY